jgi:hypothetical protein
MQFTPILRPGNSVKELREGECGCGRKQLVFCKWDALSSDGPDDVIAFVHEHVERAIFRFPHVDLLFRKIRKEGAYRRSFLEIEIPHDIRSHATSDERHGGVDTFQDCGGCG